MIMTVTQLFLIDVDYRTEWSGEDVGVLKDRSFYPMVRLWGVDEKGNSILVVDGTLIPYFYLLPKEGVNPWSIVEAIHCVKEDFPPLLKIEVLEKRFFGKPVEAVKVSFRNPDLVGKYVSTFSEIPGVQDHLEDDIRYSTRYLIDYRINPSGWLKVEGEEIGKTYPGVDKVYVARATPEPVKALQIPKLKILAFSIVCYSSKGDPKPEHDPVVLVTVKTSTGERRHFKAEDGDDKPTVEAFIDFMHSFNPDIIVGYGTNHRDWSYLVERAKRLGVRLQVDRDNSEPHTSVYGHISVTGRGNIDLYDFTDDITQVKVKTLENVADYLGVMKPAERTMVDEFDIPTYWEDPAKRPILLKWALENVESVMGISTVLLDFTFQLSNLVGLPVDNVGAAATGFRVESHLINQAFAFNELIPRRLEQPYIPYKGAIVLEPKKGVHEGVAALDFKALYPNLMIAYNLSPDTYLEPGAPDPPTGTHIAPEIGHRFVKEPEGFYKKALSRLIAARDEIRKALVKLPPTSLEYRVLDARQRAVKIITNACYGYAGWVGARWYLKPVAEATAAWGRATILGALNLARALGLEVIYSDTDSIFIKYDEEKTRLFLAHVRENIGLEIKPDEFYERVLFTEAKKKYAGLLSDGRLNIAGFEVARGDWTEASKNVQEKVLEILLKEKAPEKAVEYVRCFIRDLKDGRVPYRDLILWKTLTKPLGEYKVKTPHVEAARKLMKEGWRLTLGDKVGYVVTRKPGKLYEKVEPYILSSYENLDFDYYVKNQVVPAALRVLEQFDVTEEHLSPPPKPWEKRNKPLDDGKLASKQLLSFI